MERQNLRFENGARKCSCQTVVLLLQEPDLVDETSLDPRIALELSGHAHGDSFSRGVSRQSLHLTLGRYTARVCFRVPTRGCTPTVALV